MQEQENIFKKSTKHWRSPPFTLKMHYTLAILEFFKYFHLLVWWPDDGPH